MSTNRISFDRFLRGRAPRRMQVADFGLARGGGGRGRGVLARARLSGTAPWMAPELLRGSGPTIASDVYSFAILMSEVSAHCWSHACFLHSLVIRGC